MNLFGRGFVWLCVICGSLVVSGEIYSQSQAFAAERPNIVYILADDLGYGDLGCYGQKDIRTPHLDQMAREGMRFTQHYAGSPVCAPSRSCLMTGQHTGHTPIRGNKEVRPEGQWPLPADAVTLAEVLKKAGYVTGAFGKWGLGYPGSEGDPINQGFDEFFGYNCQRLAHSQYPYHLWHNKTKVMLRGNEDHKNQQYAPDLIQKQALAFIESNKDRPFFLYVPCTLPHAELLVPEDEIVKSYRGRWPEKPYKGVDSGPRYKLGPYASCPTPKANYAAMVTRLDMYVGQIRAKLKELGLERNTLIIFSSDNGPHAEGGANPAYFKSNDGLRGKKRDVYEGGIRVPMIACWPGKIAPGTVSDHVSAFWDVLPTLAELVGVEPPKNIDGISFLPTLLGHPEQQRQHKYLYWEFYEGGGKQAVRLGDWKGVRLHVARNPNGPIELYNLKNDLHEDHNVAAEHPEVVSQIERIMKEAHVDSPIFKFSKLRKRRHSGKRRPAAKH